LGQSFDDTQHDGYNVVVQVVDDLLGRVIGWVGQRSKALFARLADPGAPIKLLRPLDVDIGADDGDHHRHPDTQVAQDARRQLPADFHQPGAEIDVDQDHHDGDRLDHKLDLTAPGGA